MALSFSAGEILYYGLLDYDSCVVCHLGYHRFGEIYCLHLHGRWGLYILPK